MAEKQLPKIVLDWQVEVMRSCGIVDMGQKRRSEAIKRFLGFDDMHCNALHIHVIHSFTYLILFVLLSPMWRKYSRALSETHSKFGNVYTPVYGW